MKIVFDSSVLTLTKGGTAVYVRELLHALQTSGDNNIYESVRPQQFSSGLVLAKSLNTLYRELIWQQIGLPRRAASNKADLIHFPAGYAPVKCPIPYVLTVHDLYTVRNPMAFRKWHAMFLNRLLPIVIKNSERVIAVSEFTKEEIIRIYNVNPNKIKVIYNGVSDRFRLGRDADSLQRVRTKYHLPPRFILYVGAVEPRKNLGILLKAFEAIRVAFPLKLVIVSFGGWRNDGFYKLIRELKVADDIHLIGYVDDADLPIVYKLADLFVYPSKYEGFGLPILEAMASGCPVVASDIPVARELLGSSGVLFDPDRVDDLVESLKEMLSSQELTRNYRRMVAERSRMFNWRISAQMTRQCYAEIVS